MNTYINSYFGKGKVLSSELQNYIPAKEKENNLQNYTAYIMCTHYVRIMYMKEYGFFAHLRCTIKISRL